MTSAERDKIREIIPHNYVVFATVTRDNHKDISLKSTEWAIITQIDSVKTMDDIAENLSLTEDECLNYFYNLLSKNLIEIKDLRRPEHQFATPEFFNAMEAALTQTIGPVAPLIIEDILFDLNAKKSNLSKDRVPQLIERISTEIKDEDKRVQFQQQMLKQYKQL